MAEIHGNTKHGMCSSPEYISWAGMVQRCTYPKHNRYAHYLGKGITVCDEWIGSFKRFYEDMGAKPTPKHSIDRIDNDGNYEPSNCKWSTGTEQARNKSVAKSNTTGVTGVSLCKTTGRYRVVISVNYKIHQLGRFDTLAEAKAVRLDAEARYWGK